MAAHLQIGTRRLDNERYEGVIRRGKEVVVACRHQHHNRDTSTQTNGQSARDCIDSLARASRYPGWAKNVRAAIRRTGTAYARSGWQTTASSVQRMQEAAEVQAAAFDARLPEIAAALGNEPVYGYKDKITIMPTGDPQ